MKFSEKLMNLRKSKGMSQEELATKLNVTRQTVSKWELDQTVPDMNKLIEISKIFNVSLDELVSNTETSKLENKYKESPAEKNNRKIALKIFIVGIIISAIVLTFGWIKQKEIIKKNEQAYNDAYALSQAKVDQAKKVINEKTEQMNNLNETINNLKIEISNLQNESEKIFVEDKYFSNRYNEKNNEIKAKETTLFDLENQYTKLGVEVYELQNGNYAVNYNIVEPIKYLIFYYIGMGIAGFTVLTSLIYFLVTRRK